MLANAIDDVVKYVKGLINMTHFNFDPPDDEMFCLWRAVFALVHVDGEFSDAEKVYIDKMSEIFVFTDAQKSVIQNDIKSKARVAVLFDDIQSDDYRRQFFVMARTIVWCDGFLHELELQAIEKIVHNLGQNAEKFQKELRWIDRKPIINEGQASHVPQEDVMRTVLKQMTVFYKEKSL